MSRVLVANRGEIAVRIIRTVQQTGAHAIAVHTPDDATAAHVHLAEETVELPGQGVAGYLDIDAVIDAARRTGAELVHPGYGFLSENPDFAGACEAAGLVFIGPSAQTLTTVGDKVAARALAAEAGIPTLPGLPAPVSPTDALDFFDRHGAVMVKAAAGGGGRGMREVHAREDLAAALERCAAEAQAAFGNGAVYVEKLLDHPRHVEVQVLADAHGSVSHLWDRDCSIQRRHQKVVEVAPSPHLDADLRARIIAAGVDLAAAADYRGIGTVEFLVADGDFWFIEVNPRLQVEHTVTEEITDTDLVQIQLQLAAGASLADLGLDAPQPPTRAAVQARVNAEALGTDGEPQARTGVLTSFVVPTGPRIRVDTAAYAGWEVTPRFDSLLAKVIGTGATLAQACDRVARGLEEFEIAGLETNLAVLHGVLTDTSVREGVWDTGYWAATSERLAGHVMPRRGPVHDSGDGPGTDREVPADPARQVEVPEGGRLLRSPMAGVVLSVTAADRSAPAGADLVVLESMKMEQVVRADDEVAIHTALVSPGDLVAAGDPLLVVVTPAEAGPGTASTTGGPLTAEPDDWSEEVAEIHRRRGWVAAMGGEAKIARQTRSGRMTARARIDALCGTEPFAEIGALSGFAVRDDEGRTTFVQPTNFIAGTTRIDGRKVALGVDDFTVRGGSGDAAIHEKQMFLERYANQMRLPMVRLLDGQSGGGSVKMALDAGYTYVPVNPAWDAVVDNLSVVPVVSACLGPTVGLGAARLVMSHFAVMVEGIGQLFTAGPPVVAQALGEELTKEQLGGAEVHRGNGSVERVVASEAEAFDLIRSFLSYLPSSVFEAPPVIACEDPADRREDTLLGAIPHNPRRTYAIDPVLAAIFDRGSVLSYAEYGGGTVTALARLDGHPVGVVAADSEQGATMSVEGALALTRLVDLCETFHLPIVSLTDQAGMSIGRAAEERATIRHGARALAAVYQARVPQAEIILRRVYGVGGAGIVNRHRPMRSWAWPSGDWGSLPMQGGIEAAFGAALGSHHDPAAETERLRRELTDLGSPFRTAEHFGVQDLIDPRETRPVLCDWVRDAYRQVPTLLGRPGFGARP